MTDLPRENVQSYPRPPRLEPVPQRIRVILGGAVVADTGSALRVLETHHAPALYLPAADVPAALHPVPGTSLCEWKGVARYFDVIAGGRTAPRAAWACDRPTAGFAALAGHVAFYAGPMDEAWVGEVRVVPQPCEFFGGWVTPNLEGRIKGAPGTRHWQDARRHAPQAAEVLGGDDDVAADASGPCSAWRPGQRAPSAFSETPQTREAAMAELNSTPDGRWRFFTDQVMGGISMGGVTFAQQDGMPHVRMTGRVRTANRGGFIQMRIDLPDPPPEGATGVPPFALGDNAQP